MPPAGLYAPLGPSHPEGPATVERLAADLAARLDQPGRSGCGRCWRAPCSACSSTPRSPAGWSFSAPSELAADLSYGIRTLRTRAYPLGLKGDEIAFEARIVTVADVGAAMASHRPYRPARGVEKALQEVLQHRGVLYDAAVVEACLRLFRERGFDFQ